MMKEEKKKVRFLGSLNGKGTSFAGAIWDKKSVSPTLTTMQGGQRATYYCVR